MSTYTVTLVIEARDAEAANRVLGDIMNQFEGVSALLDMEEL